uniref:Uncharacterized protein n=1 Tax=Anguilla anguilla TaxID=7936 RepID=A0A0E9Q3F1_ANGAN
MWYSHLTWTRRVHSERLIRTVLLADTRLVSAS